MVERPPFLLAELEDLSPIFAPLKNTSRIKYTCFNVSNNYLMLGATSGGVYVFRREPCVFLQLLPNKEGSVTQLAISPDEKFVAFSTVRGVVSVLERLPSHAAKLVVSSSEHVGAQVTWLAWSRPHAEVYVGDEAGRVSVVSVAARTMFQAPSFVLMQLDSRVVQMDIQDQLLLVSTMTKCYVCDTSKEMFRQIGQKPRDGEYGACVVGTGTDAKLYCARPGSRIWEVKVDGSVVSTHQFKQALAVPPHRIIFQNTARVTTSSEPAPSGQSFNFPRLLVILSNFLVTFKQDGIYIFDPEKANVVLWSDELTDIADVRCVSDVIYVWLNTGKMYAFNLVLLEKFLIRLYFRKKYLALARYCVEYKEYLNVIVNESNKLHLLHDLDVKLRESTESADVVDNLCESLRPLLTVLKASAEQRQMKNAHRLQSGIYLIGNEAQLFAEENGTKALRPSFLNLKGRSHSASPERIKSQSSSTSSLPDMSKENEGKMEEEEDGTPDVKIKKQFVEEKECKEDVEELVAISRKLEATREPSNDLIFCLLDSVVALATIECCLTAVASCVPIYTLLPDNLVKLVSEVFHSALRSRLVLQWLDKFKQPQPLVHPSFLVDNCNTAARRRDFLLSKLLKLFADVLDENQIIELVLGASGECYYLSLVEVLDRFQDTSLSSVSESTLHISNITPPTKTLNIVYFLMKMGQVDKCARYSSKLDLLQMMYLVLRFEQSLLRGARGVSAAELQAYTLFLSYIDKSDLTEVTYPQLVERYVICGLERVNASASCVSVAHCPCGFPLFSKPNFPVTIFADIGIGLLSRATPAGRIALCSRVPQLWHHQLLLRREESLIAVLPLLLHLNAMEELEFRLEEMDLVLFEVVMRHYIGLKNGNCLNCGGKFETEMLLPSLTVLGLLAVKALGPSSATDVMSKYASDLESSEVEQCLFQAIVFSAIMEKHSKGLRKNVVKLLTDERLPATPHTENGLRQAWGVKLDCSEACTVCKLPLHLEVLVGEWGVSVFRCGHAFHVVCVSESDVACPTCTSTL